jgi:hypothetical protein
MPRFSKSYQNIVNSEVCAIDNLYDLIYFYAIFTEYIRRLFISYDYTSVCMSSKFDTSQVKEGSEDNKKLTLDQKIVRSLSAKNKTYAQLKEEFRIVPSTLTSCLKRLMNANLIEDIGDKTYSLKSNPDLEKIILEECPFKNLDELTSKLENKTQYKAKFAKQKSALEFSIQKLEVENLIFKSKDTYKLSDYGCIKIQHCIECRKKVEDGSTQIVTLFNLETSGSLHYVLHSKCYVAKNLKHSWIEHDTVNCDYCGLTLDYDGLVNQQSKFDWTVQLYFYLNNDEKHNLENRDRNEIANLINKITGEKLEGKKMQFASDKPYSPSRSYVISLKITEKNVDKLLKEYRTLLVKIDKKVIRNKSKKILSIANFGFTYKRIESSSELDFKNDNTAELKFSDTNYKKPFSFSTLEKFYLSFTKTDDPKLFENRINELFSILVQIRDKKMNEAKIQVDKLFDPISIITAHAETPNYNVNYPDEVGSYDYLEKVTGMQRVVKENGKTFHPYCAKVVEENQKKESEK